VSPRKTPPDQAGPVIPPEPDCRVLHPSVFPDADVQGDPAAASEHLEALAAAGPKQPGPVVGGKPAAGLGANPVAEAMSEDDLEAGMRRILKDLRLKLAYHPWKYHAKRAREGFPDWTITGPGGLIFRELKRQGEEPTPAQQAWLDTLAAWADADVWYPSDLLSGRIARELAAIAGLVSTR
jgi:hypothetical protein